MKKLLAIVALVIVLCGCPTQGIDDTKTNNPNFSVSFLFEHEGCRIYRFYDVLSWRYFANCTGSISWQESCGKDCTRLMEIPTTRR